MHFNAFSSVLFEKNASNKLTSGGGGQFFACRSQQNMMKYDKIIIKILSKYHQNTIKISSKHVGTRQKIKLQSAEGGRHPLGNALKSSMYAAILAVTAFPYGRSQKLTPPVDLKKCNFIRFYQVFFGCYSKGEQTFFSKIF